MLIAPPPSFLHLVVPPRCTDLHVVPLIGQAVTSAVNSRLVWNWNGSSKGTFVCCGRDGDWGSRAVVVVGLRMEGGWIGLWYQGP